MKKILLITLIFILQSIPSFGSSIEGKGLICEHPKFEWYIGFFFEGGKVFTDRFDVSKDKYRITALPTHEYETTKNLIYWDEKFWKLDRKKLELTISTDINKLSCEVIEHLTAYENRLNYLLQKLQNEYDEETKDNKI